ncbi:transporter substrate-binding domain-containing protein [Brucella rhizosphaerae]|uniref:Bacterial extracellular solute-binding, 3 family protein n=1 Tax=Brucella rhizosphaerae TaxID=571254 RepID=A0A256FLT3_9HYPH|nr:transporter substrate-binding domain-containing protein [Brucella rhizosphaerae]OYR15805.1 bacterial extracellular solute-binding, 3 family protein [Brucella rhizosphaerae]
MQKICSSFLLAFASVFSIATAAIASELPRLAIATEGYLRPYNLTRPDGTLDGYEIELGNYLCAHMKVTCTFVAQPFDGMIAGLNVGKYDAIMAGLSATPAREKVIDFSTSYSLTPQVFATMKGSRYDPLPHTGQSFYLPQDTSNANGTIRDIAQAIKGAKVGVVIGAINAALVDQYFKSGVQVVSYKTAEEAVMDLKAGRIDLIVHSRAFLNASENMPEYKSLVMTGPYFKGGILGRGVGVGIRKNDPKLREKFDDAIAAAKTDGTITRLSMKWFGFDVTP